ncbi:ABC transporter ATP-binding protein [uncultured Lactobacillus sp.]|uniref:ATP-binding cassette domain-containing protein n=1 Tax=uncultured Lactobacillus sp. TaxID=153152 RepID=UPI0026033EDB|nr:ABC transporter ATP-binding protein [uncultured Lactobacillus sp.]
MDTKGIFNTNKIRFVYICVLLVLETVTATSVTYLMTPAFNYIKKNNLNLFLIFIVLSASLQFVSTVLDAIVNILYVHQVQDYIHQIRNNITRYLFVSADQKVSEIQNNLNSNIQELSSKYSTPLLTLFHRILAITFSIGVLFTFNWSLVALTLLLAFIGLYLPKLFEKMTSSATFKVTKENEQLLDTIEKWAQGLDELRRYASFGSYEGAIKKSTSNLKAATLRDCFWGNLATAITSIVSLLGIILLLVLSIYLYATGKIVFGAVITSGIFANQIMNAVTYIAESLNQIKSSKKLRQEMENLQHPVIFPNKNDSDEKIAQIEVNNLHVSYENGQSIVYPHILINKGEKVLLTGDSGTGKSTLFKVLLGQLKPERGNVEYRDTAGISFIPNSEEIGYISQDNTLFPDTIKSNITMFDSKLNKEVEAAVEKVQLAADIKKMPNGLMTQVDLDKGNLSGGQKQKVVLARANIHNSNLLLIDEATSAVDSATTEAIIKELLKSKQTIIMIAHNFSQDMIDMFDREIHLKKEVD